MRRSGEHREDEPGRLHAAGLQPTRRGPVGLPRDHGLLDLVTSCERGTARRLTWPRTRVEQAAPQPHRGELTGQDVRGRAGAVPTCRWNHRAVDRVT